MQENKIVLKEKKKRIYQPEEISLDLNFQKNLENIYEQLNKQTEIIKNLKASMKKLENDYVHDINKAHKAKRSKTQRKDSGFISKRLVPNELAKFINCEEGQEMSMPTYTKKFCEELKIRGLFYEKDKRVYRADKEVKKLFDFDDKINKSVSSTDKNGFNFSTLQKNISNAFIKYSKPQAPPVAVQQVATN